MTSFVRKVETGPDSQTVCGGKTPRVKECPAQLEASVRRIHMLDGDARLRTLGGGAAVEVEVLRAHLQQRSDSQMSTRAISGGDMDQPSLNAFDASKETIMVTLCIRYTIEPHMHNDFEQYARNWPEPIKRCGGELLGYFLPTKLAGATNTGYALINFPNLAVYEKRLRDDPDAQQNVATADRSGCILIEDRSILQPIR
jgi:hypothetical protein